MEKKFENLGNNIVNALIEYNASEGNSAAMYHAIGDIELTNEVLLLMSCFNEDWECADSKNDQELDNILYYYSNEIINWLKANGLYDHALNYSRYER